MLLSHQGQFDNKLAGIFGITRLTISNRLDKWKQAGPEEYYKSIKQNAVAKAPVKTSNTQANHLFASICAFVKLEGLKVGEYTKHFAPKTKLYMKAAQAAFKN